MLIGIFDPMGAQSDRLRCEVCQNLILSPMNTGFLRYAVATALTVYGIETTIFDVKYKVDKDQLQQHLPFTVLKLKGNCDFSLAFYCVATALTVYGIETLKFLLLCQHLIQVATALTVYGIETVVLGFLTDKNIKVATALTVYGIETN